MVWIRTLIRACNVLATVLAVHLSLPLDLSHLLLSQHLSIICQMMPLLRMRAMKVCLIHRGALIAPRNRRRLGHRSAAKHAQECTPRGFTRRGWQHTRRHEPFARIGRRANGAMADMLLI